MNKHLKSALLCGLLVGGTTTLSAQAPQPKQTPQSTQTPQSPTTPQTQSQGTAERAGTMGRVKEYNAGQKLVIDIAGAPERSYDLSSKDQDIVVAPGLKAGDSVRIVENNVNGKRTINITMDNSAKK